MNGDAAEASVAVDIGGTFTDVVVLTPQGSIESGKYLTTNDDPTEGVLTGINDVLRRAGVAPAAVGRVTHATTLATNVILERRGVPVAFVTTRGFGDLLSLGRAARTESSRFDLSFDAPEPPLPRANCFEVTERISARGEVLRAFDTAGAEEVVGRIAELGVAGVAIAFVNSYANPAHELAMAELCRKALPDVVVVASAEIWPEHREYERATTALASAYVGPVMRGYLRRLTGRLATIGIDCPVHIMESSGGVMSADLAADRAVFTIESGPAAGVTAAQHLGAELGFGDVISFDMGGTTAKAGVIRDGRPDVVREFYVGGSGSFGGRREGTGIPIKAPVIDLAEVGAGGGSIAWVDVAGSLRVGPRSAGSAPGPVCYGTGGSEPTVTDANLLLGYLSPTFSSGEAVVLDASAAATALVDRVASRLGVDMADAALAIHEIANANMASAVHVVTVQRGIDPRAFLLVALGGAGPMHAARVAERFGMTRVVVPPSPGVGSAVGLLSTDLSAERVQTARTETAEADLGAVTDLFETLADATCADLGLSRGEVTVTRMVDMRYVGQAHEIAVEGSDGPVDDAWIERLEAQFAAEYRRRAGSSMDGPTEMVNFRVRISQPVAGAHLDVTSAATTRAPRTKRLAYFRETGGFVDVDVLHRSDCVLGDRRAGPLIVEEPVSTTIVPPGWEVVAGAHGELLLERSDA